MLVNISANGLCHAQLKLKAPLSAMNRSQIPRSERMRRPNRLIFTPLRFFFYLRNRGHGHGSIPAQKVANDLEGKPNDILSVR